MLTLPAIHTRCKFYHFYFMPLNKPSSISISFDCHIDHQLNYMFIRVCVCVCIVGMSCMSNVFKIEAYLLSRNRKYSRKVIFLTIWLCLMFFFSLPFNLRQKMKMSFMMGNCPLPDAKIQLADFIKIRYFSINWIYTWMNVLFVFNRLK